MKPELAEVSQSYNIGPYTLYFFHLNTVNE